MLQVEIKDKDKFLASFAKFPDMVAREIRKEMKASLAEIVQEAGQNHTYVSRSGQLDKNANFDVTVSGSGFEGKIVLNQRIPYSHIQHEGGTIAASKIIPKKPGGYLKFNIGNEIFYRKRIFKDIVIKATKFLYNAASRMERVFVLNMEMAIGRAITKAGF